MCLAGTGTNYLPCSPSIMPREGRYAFTLLSGLRREVLLRGAPVVQCGSIALDILISNSISPLARRNLFLPLSVSQ